MMRQTVHFSVINYIQMESGFATGKRIFDYHYLLYVHKGTGRYKIGNTMYDTKMGDILYCPPGVGNTIYADEEDPFVLSGLEFTVEHHNADALPIAEKINIAADTFLVMCINEMIKEYCYHKTDASDICDEILSVLLMRLSRISMQKGAEVQDTEKELLEYIINNFNQPLTHQKLSKIFSYHKNSINRMLLKATNMTLNHYLIDIRMKKACEFLAYSNKTVAEIAELCGYSSSAFFSRQFRQKMGITPLEYRRNA